MGKFRSAPPIPTPGATPPPKPKTRRKAVPRPKAAATPPSTPATNDGGKPGGKVITKYLTQMAEDATAVDREATCPAEELAQITWKLARGWVTEQKTGVPKVEKPAKWAIELIYDRLEGRMKPTEAVAPGRPPIQDRIRDVARADINDIAESCADETDVEGTVPGYTADLDVSENGIEGSEDAGS